ncbi:MAG: glycosyltransferase family 1 protein [Actinobacteria bacterium]|nr:MAG: glycosyltransferase family 1 protein [Actinomycetota bacterium]
MVPSGGHTLVVTNDFPPRAGGIQSFVQGLVSRQPADSVTVYAPAWKGAAAYDAGQPYEVVRHRTSLMLPEPFVIRRARELMRTTGASRVLYGAAAPLGLISDALRGVGAEHIVGLTHGHEAAWAALPGSSQALRVIGDRTDTITFLGEYTRVRIAGALSRAAAARMRQLVPGVDDQLFHPRNLADGMAVRARHGLAGRPVIVCVSRLMPRKGQDTLIEALPLIQRSIPDAALLIVGGGPYRQKLQDLVAELGLGRDVVLTGTVPWEELPAHYAAGDVFAMPCRTRNRGLDVEGLGIVYLEASATGLPVVAGDSGGAPDAVLEGETGYVVPGGDPQAVASRLIELLADDDLRSRLGAGGRAWIEAKWRWPLISDRLSLLLAGQDPDA